MRKLSDEANSEMKLEEKRKCTEEMKRKRERESCLRNVTYIVKKEMYLKCRRRRRRQLHRVAWQPRSAKHSTPS